MRTVTTLERTNSTLSRDIPMMMDETTDCIFESAAPGLSGEAEANGRVAAGSVGIWAAR